MVSPQDRRAAVAHVRQAHGASGRRACGLVGQPRSTQRYEAKAKPEDTLPKRIAELAAERPRFGYRRLTALLKREGVAVWHGRVHRITKASRCGTAGCIGSRRNCGCKCRGGNESGLRARSPVPQRLRDRINAGAWT